MAQQQAPATTHGAVRTVINNNANDAESRLTSLETGALLLAGRSGGQIAYGSPNTNEDLSLRANSVDANAARIDLTNGALLINPAAADIDTIIEGISNANLVTIDAGNDNVGIGIAPDSDFEFHVLGKVRVQENDANPALEIYRNDLTIGGGSDLGRIHFGGAEGGANTSAGRIACEAAQSWDTGKQGTYIGIHTTENDTTTLTEQFRVDNDGGVFMFNLKSGTDQANAGAAADEIFYNTTLGGLDLGT